MAATKKRKSPVKKRRSVRASSIMRELKRIEEEEKVIETEEKIIEQRQDVLRTLEELGLMRWKSYYVLTAGAILLLALTFVTSLWVMNDQLLQIQDSVDATQEEISEIQAGVQLLEIRISNLDVRIHRISTDTGDIKDLLSGLLAVMELAEEMP